MSNDTFGLYVHFPYCLSKCPYCDFASRAATVVPHERYADAVLRELELRAEAFPKRQVTSIYFGGGTPSLWDAAQVKRVMDGLQAAYPLASDVEATLEANPGAADEARFAAYRDAGFNRLSIGAQSFQPDVLVSLGRQHSPQQVGQAVRSARAAGFDNISVDLIYGAPGHTPERVRDDARRAIDLGTEHLSAYALTLVHLAEEVPMARDLALGRIQVPDDDSQADMGEVLREELRGAGFERYEISNWTRTNQPSRHNLQYWRGGGWLALGTGAVGFALGADARTGVRYANKRSPEHWLAAVESGVLPEKDREEITAGDLFLERIFTGLRLAEGLDLVALDALCSTAIAREKAELLEQLSDRGLVTWDGRRVALTDRGLDLHTSIAGELVS